MTTQPIPVCKFSFNKVSVYTEYPHSFGNSKRVEIGYYDVSENEHLAENDKKSNAHLGNLSEQAHTRLLTCVKKFVWVTHVCNEEKRKRKEKRQKTLKFVTLTLASDQIHQDSQIKEELLNQFLTELRQDFNLENYLWKAEKQKNGSIHFHLIIDIFIPWQVIRNKWNRIQEKLGYVRRFRENIKKFGFSYYLERSRVYHPDISLEKVQERWQKGEQENWKNPPGTEIRNIENQKLASFYAAKYISKESSIQPGFGRIWFISRSLSKNVYVYDMPSNGFWEIIDALEKQDKVFLMKLDWCNLYFFDMRLLRLFPNNYFTDKVLPPLLAYAFEFW